MAKTVHKHIKIGVKSKVSNRLACAETGDANRLASAREDTKEKTVAVT